MASTAFPIAARPGTLAPALPFLVAAAVYVLLLLAGDKLLNDADTWWHIASGNWILANGFPHADPFSFTFAGKPWIAKEWLSQVAYAEAFRLAGWTGVVVLAAAAIALAFGLLTHALRGSLTGLPAVAMVAVAFMLVAPHATARPHALALPLLIAWAAGLARAADRQKAPPYALLLLMVAWANLHAGFTFGILLVAAFALDAVVAAPSVNRRRLAIAWVRFGLLTMVAACVTPYGPQSTLLTAKVLGLGPALSVIGEWRPADFATVGPLELALVAGIGFALWRGVTLPPVRILILLGLVHMALSADRNAELLGLVAPLVVAGPLARQFPLLRAGQSAPSFIGGAMLAALALPVTALLALLVSYQPSPANAPGAALTALKATNAAHVLNDYNFGGYLIAAGVLTFIDGRTELFGADFLLRYVRDMRLENIPDLLNLLDDQKIDATLLMPSTPAAAFLDRDPGWKRLYADDTAVVHIRLPLRGSLN